MNSIKLPKIVVLFLLTTVIGVFSKSLSIPVLSDHANKIEFALLGGIAGLLFFYNKKVNIRNRRLISGLFLAYVVISLLSSFSNFELINILQILLNSKFILAVVVFSTVQSVSFKSVYSLMCIFSLINFTFILLEVLSPSIYSSIMTGAITDTIIQGTNVKRYAGVFYHPGPMGAFATCMLIISAIRIFNTKKTNWDIITVCISLLAVLASGQRLETAAMVLSLIICYLLIRVRRKIYVLGVVAAIPLFIYISYSSLLNTSNARLDNHSNARLVLYVGGVKLANTYFPFGRGLSTYGSSTSEISSENAYYEVGINKFWWFEGANYLTDTFWAMIIGESGWLGGIFYLLILLILLKNSFDKLLLFSEHTDSWIYKVGFTISLFFLINSFASPVYSGATLPILLAALFIGHVNSEKEQ